LKEILKKVNRILVEVTYIDRKLNRLENKITDQTIRNQENNINEEAFTFNTISSINELQLFEENLKNEVFRENGKCLFLLLIIIIINNTLYL